jgi:hypothetical protein
MLILFLHGWQSTPGGVKPTFLKSHGHEVLNPTLPDLESLETMLKACEAQPDGEFT